MCERDDGGPNDIHVVGADANNLRCVDLDVPLRGITVVTGVSGSGKSSLLADTLGAEGARRTRRFLGQSQAGSEVEDVPAFIGRLPPTVTVGQRGFRPSIRTTVATATGMLSVLRRLFLRAGRPVSDLDAREVGPPTPEGYADWLANHYRGDVEIWAVPVRSRRTSGATAVARLAENGVSDLRVYSETDTGARALEGRRVAAAGFKGLNPNVTHTIEALISTVKVTGPASGSELRDALALAFAAGKGSVVVMLPRAGDPALESAFGHRLDSHRHWVIPEVAEVFHPASVHLLSFNAPTHEDSGACRTCAGTGVARRVRLDRLVTHPERSMNEGAFSLWTPRNYRHVNIQHDTLRGLAGRRGFSPDRPWKLLAPGARELVIAGAGDEPVQDLDTSGRKFGRPRPFPGFERAILQKAASGSGAKSLADLVDEGSCGDCGGTRWSFQARAIRVGGLGLAEILAMPASEIEGLCRRGGEWINAVEPALRSLVSALGEHAASLRLAGLSYIAGDRGMLTVSGGESRRIRLARVVEAGEAGLCLLFDEPARGLHESDLDALGEAIGRLRGHHTVILNEHRQRLWNLADHFVVVGPGAGAEGGRIVYAGPPVAVRRRQSGSERRSIPIGPRTRRITIRDARIHNLDGIDCSIPLGRMTSICGVSGSGKSSFVRGILAPAIGGGVAPDFDVHHDGTWKSVSGRDAIARLVALDQVAPAPNRRSLVATATGAFDRIRKAFGDSPDAGVVGLSASDFGLNAGMGRCQTCLGLGELEEDGVLDPCPSCGGARWGAAALAVRVEGLNIRDLLDTPLDRLGSAAPFGIPSGLVSAIVELGIGYLSLGRRVDSMSGGEIQRLRLAMRLSQTEDRDTLFLLDEPAAGLHPDDVDVLVAALNRVVAQGTNTLVIVEHDMEIIRQSDWVVEFGPGAGPEGGRIVFEGTPADLQKADTATGRALRRRASRPTGRRTIPRLPKPTSSLIEQAERTAALVKALVGEEAPTGDDELVGVALPTALLDLSDWSEHDAWEVGGLDEEVPKLLLDLWETGAPARQAALLETWAKHPPSSLAVHPCMREIAVWGDGVPSTALKQALERLKAEGLHLISGKASAPRGDVAAARATGERLQAEDEAGRAAAVREALMIGGGYVELVDGSGGVLCSAGPRLVDLDRSLVGPARPVPSDFSRHRRRGRCPACAGTRSVPGSDEALVVRDARKPPLEPGFLTDGAEQVTRGAMRNMLGPLLRRFEKEGLWPSGATFESLSPHQRGIVLHGCWARPGPGSFLKTPKADPAEVSSWLRWDGLHREVLSGAERGRDAAWAKAVKASERAVPCPVCRGSGLKAHATLLRIGGMDFSTWANRMSPKRQIDALDGLELTSERQRATARRLVGCLSPLARGGGIGEVLEECVRRFTTMQSTRI